MTARLKRLLNEPVAQFLVIGGLIYGIAQIHKAPTPTRIVITANLQQELLSEFTRNHRRTPSTDEWQQVLNKRIADEAIVNEALRLSLDQNDPIVRRRLLQKMNFILQARAQPLPPDEATLLDYFNQHKQQFTELERRDIEQRFFAANKEAALVALNKPEVKGEYFDRGYRFAEYKRKQIQDLFGKPFTELAFDSNNTGEWLGPVQSPFGWHLIRISAIHPAGPPDFDKHRKAVYQAHQEEQKETALRAARLEITHQYEVVVQDFPLAPGDSDAP